mgnify:CR=1 FL=1
MYLFIDVGATNTKIGISKNLKKLDIFYKINTPNKYKEFLVLLRNFLNNKKFKKVIVGFAGMVKNGKILKAPNTVSYTHLTLPTNREV